jgi:hypothetical protein
MDNQTTTATLKKRLGNKTAAQKSLTNFAIPNNLFIKE